MRDDEDDDYMSDRHLAKNISLTLRHTLDCEQYAQREREEALDMTGGSDADFYVDIAIGLIANTLLLLDQAGFDVGVAEKKLIKDQITVNDAQEFIQTASDKLSSALTKVEHLINKAATIIKTEETE